VLKFAGKYLKNIIKYRCLVSIVNLLINFNMLLSEQETSYNSKTDWIKLHLMKGKSFLLVLFWNKSIAFKNYFHTIWGGN